MPSVDGLGVVVPLTAEEGAHSRAILPDPCSKTPLPSDFAGGPQASLEPERYKITPIGDLTVRRENTWLIKGLLPQTGFGLIFGPSGSGKSFVALDIAAHVALGRLWNGKSVSACGVVYAGLEGQRDVENRLLVLREKMPQLADAPFGVMFDALSLLDDSDVLPLMERLTQAVNDLGSSVGLIIIDTLARASGGANENDAADMTALVGAAEVLGRAIGALVILVHHSPWDAKRPRGSTALYAACDVILEVDGASDIHSVRVAKNKAGRDDECWAFHLDQVELGVDKDGDLISSCVVHWREVTARAHPSPKLSPTQVLSLRGLTNALMEVGVSHFGHCGEAVRAVTRQQWRREAIRAGVTDATDPKIQADAARRVEKLLIARKIVAMRDEMVWRCDDATARDHHATVANPAQEDHATSATAPYRAVASVAPAPLQVSENAPSPTFQEISTKPTEAE